MKPAMKQDDNPHGVVIRPDDAVRFRLWAPAVERIPRGGTFHVLADGAVSVKWQVDPAGELSLWANLSATPVTGDLNNRSVVIWKEGNVNQKDGTLEPWTVLWSVNT